MSASISTEQFLIDGPAGLIEVLVEEPKGGCSGWGMVLHPHPLMGGSMGHKLPYMLSKALLEMQYCSVRFNFRGVGRSHGCYGNGVGEIEDAVSVLFWCRERYSGIDQTALFAFSFGAFVGSHIVNDHYFNRIVLAGLPSSSFECLEVPKHTLVIHGEYDEIIPLDAVYEWADPQNIPVIVFPRANHFFDRRLVAFKDFILLFYSAK